MDRRKASVLRAVVRDHVRTAEPVASVSLARRHRLGVSPATIRHEMAELEDMGYLVQPHTSAGRIPTDTGYRFYVDTLPRRLPLSPTRRRSISAFFGEVPPDVDEMVQGTTHLLSRITGYAAVALPPRIAESRVVGVDLVRLGAAAMLVAVGDTGRVDKRSLELPAAVDEEVLRRLHEDLAGAFSGLSYEEAGTRALAMAERAHEPDRAVLRAVAGSFRDLGGDPDADRVFLGGVANIAGEEAFERRESMQRLFEALEEGRAVRGLLGRLPTGEDVTVRIGRENTLRAMREASTVIAPYLIGARPAGFVAVIGPTRMEYPAAISSARAVARRLTDLIGGLAGQH